MAVVVLVDGRPALACGRAFAAVQFAAAGYVSAHLAGIDAALVGALAALPVAPPYRAGCRPDAPPPGGRRTGPPGVPRPSAYRLACTRRAPGPLSVPPGRLDLPYRIEEDRPWLICRSS
ncbi:hypothetical protein [Streptomyces benahoarensis]|uniref:Uncharacterized protein n=1 Tax=Streptomyces benahoarensis TaxID=2595054 RepID=A0A553XVA7_9ACTN|nr:hypothetical protein [Streptomyces benahoarensis]TSB20869.1 hypothetical protein FNZ23_28725 [Streptomyces benahoarensis]TSB22623.1 hypothetical protein FNJ62_16155 [Streptomyces benahoarensis]